MILTGIFFIIVIFTLVEWIRFFWTEFDRENLSSIENFSATILGALMTSVIFWFCFIFLVRLIPLDLHNTYLDSHVVAEKQLQLEVVPSRGWYLIDEESNAQPLDFDKYEFKLSEEIYVAEYKLVPDAWICRQAPLLCLPKKHEIIGLPKDLLDVAMAWKR